MLDYASRSLIVKKHLYARITFIILLMLVESCNQAPEMAEHTPDRSILFSRMSWGDPVEEGWFIDTAGNRYDIYFIGPWYNLADSIRWLGDTTPVTRHRLDLLYAQAQSSSLKRISKDSLAKMVRLFEISKSVPLQKNPRGCIDAPNIILSGYTFDKSSNLFNPVILHLSGAFIAKRTSKEADTLFRMFTWFDSTFPGPGPCFPDW